ncbi:hypothetical protein F511_33234 [Dorcoceras hygrometricum]|uniref:Uncharacterized protein n=1 Tax=Dorcoceras hygrometricum TaxID=472368 RepID=A0A2Z7CKP5_9LAMI|nr:hypothetical protein F511_33234 [Dorcoceras hygrometricum]
MTSLLMSSTLSAPAELSSSADCDDITADVIIADSRYCASSQLLIVMMSSLLLIASSRIYADVITADSRFLFASIQQLISSTSEHCSCLLTLLLKKTSGEIMLLLISLNDASAELSKPINTLSFQLIQTLSFRILQRNILRNC